MTSWLTSSTIVFYHTFQFQLKMYFIELIYTGLQKKNYAHSINLCLLDQGELSELARMNVAGKEQNAIFAPLAAAFHAAATSALVLSSSPEGTLSIGLESCELFCSCIASIIIRCLRSSASNFWNQASISSRGLNFRGMRMRIMWRENCSVPVEGVHSVGASEHGESRGNKELEVGWPGDSRRHLLAIDSSLVWCEWQST